MKEFSKQICDEYIPKLPSERRRLPVGLDGYARYRVQCVFAHYEEYFVRDTQTRGGTTNRPVRPLFRSNPKQGILFFQEEWYL